MKALRRRLGALEPDPTRGVWERVLVWVEDPLDPQPPPEGWEDEEDGTLRFHWTIVDASEP
jgi:hypothetical protein